MAERQVSIGGRDPPAARPVPRARHAEPDRVRGRLPAARGAARPLPVQDPRRLPEAEEEREIVYRMGAEPPVAAAGPRPRRAGPAAGRRVAGVRPPRAGRLRRPARRRHPHARASTAWTTSRAGSSYGASPRAPPSGSDRGRRALALVRGRDYVLPQDVLDVAAGRAAAPAGAVLRRAGRRRAGRPHRRADRADGPAAAGHRPARRRPRPGRPAAPPAPQHGERSGHDASAAAPGRVPRRPGGPPARLRAGPHPA